MPILMSILTFSLYRTLWTEGFDASVKKVKNIPIHNCTSWHLETVKFTKNKAVIIFRRYDNN